MSFFPSINYFYRLRQWETTYLSSSNGFITWKHVEGGVILVSFSARFYLELVNFFSHTLIYTGQVMLTSSLDWDLVEWSSMFDYGPNDVTDHNKFSQELNIAGKEKDLYSWFNELALMFWVELFKSSAIFNFTSLNFHNKGGGGSDLTKNQYQVFAFHPFICSIQVVLP